jgi:multidrug resistance efflux pump
VRNLDAQLALQQPVIEQESADIALLRQKTTLKFTQEQQIRYDGLTKTGCGTIQCAQQTDASLRERSRSCSTENPVARGREEGRRSHHRTSQGCRAIGSRPSSRTTDGT